MDLVKSWKHGFITKLERISLDNYLREIKPINRQEIRDIYATFYMQGEDLSQRISSASELAALKTAYLEKQNYLSERIEEELLNFKKKIYQFTGVSISPSIIPDDDLYHPEQYSYADTVEGMAKFLSNCFDHFVFSIKFGSSPGLEELDLIRHAHNKFNTALDNKLDSTPICFSDLDVIIQLCTDFYVVFNHQLALSNLISTIGRCVYPNKIAVSNNKDISDKTLDLSTRSIDLMIKDLAAGITYKGSAKYETETIITYLKKFIERPNLSRKKRRELCIQETNNDKVKKQLINRSGDTTLGNWEEKLKERLEQIRSYTSYST